MLKYPLMMMKYLLKISLLTFLSLLLCNCSQETVEHTVHKTTVEQETTYSKNAKLLNFHENIVAEQVQKASVPLTAQEVCEASKIGFTNNFKALNFKIDRSQLYHAIRIALADEAKRIEACLEPEFRSYTPIINNEIPTGLFWTVLSNSNYSLPFRVLTIDFGLRFKNEYLTSLIISLVSVFPDLWTNSDQFLEQIKSRILELEKKEHENHVFWTTVVFLQAFFKQLKLAPTKYSSPLFLEIQKLTNQSRALKAYVRFEL